MMLSLIQNFTTPQLPDLLDGIFAPNTFLRRPDLTPKHRLKIAYETLFPPYRGAVTQLAADFAISRTFAYELAAELKAVTDYIFGDRSEQTEKQRKKLRRQAVAAILSLRMEGKSSIGGISTVMTRFFGHHKSTGFASEVLGHIGESLPNHIETSCDVPLLVYVIDEIYSKGKPILIIVDAASSAILHIELCDSCSGDNWAKNLNQLKKNGIRPIYIVSDEGSGILKGCHQAFPDTIRQSDVYHAIPHKLGAWVSRLENAAFTAIEYEYDRARKLTSAKSQKVIKERRAAYRKARRHAAQKIRAYDEFAYLYRCLIHEIKLFDANGNLRQGKQVAAGVEVCLSLIESLELTSVNAMVKQIRNLMPTLFHYFDVAEQVVANLSKLKIKDEALKLYCAAWQWHKSGISAKNTPRKHHAQTMEEEYMEQAKWFHRIDYAAKKDLDIDIYQSICKQLNTIVQSSSLVECINSILRPYLDCQKNHVTQAFLNLFLFYHNNRRYVDGVRKGKTPMELLTGQAQTEDWIDLLLSKVA